MNTFIPTQSAIQVEAGTKIVYRAPGLVIEQSDIDDGSFHSIKVAYENIDPLISMLITAKVSIAREVAENEVV